MSFSAPPLRSLRLCGECFHNASLTIQYGQPTARRVRLHVRLVHQLDARRGDAEFARLLHAQGVLESGFAAEEVEEEGRALVAEFARAVPVAPTTFPVVEIEAVH